MAANTDMNSFKIKNSMSVQYSERRDGWTLDVMPRALLHTIYNIIMYITTKLQLLSTTNRYWTLLLWNITYFHELGYSLSEFTYNCFRIDILHCIVIDGTVILATHTVTAYNESGDCRCTWQLVALGKAGRPLSVTSNRYTPIKNKLAWSAAVVYCSCEILPFFSITQNVVRVVHKFDFVMQW